MKMLIFQPDNSEPTVQEITFKKREPSYDELKAIIEPITGEPFEHVSVWQLGKVRDMFVNELGRLNGLPINERATMIYRQASLKRGIPLQMLDNAFIVGPAVLFTERVWF